MYSFSMVCKKLVLKFFLLTGQPLHCQPNLNQHQRQVKLYKNGLSISISYISISISDSSPVWAPLPELLLEFLGRSLISTSAASSNSPDGDQDDDDEGDEEEEEESDDDDCDHNNFESKILMRMTITFSFSCSLSRSAACLKSPFTCTNTISVKQDFQYIHLWKEVRLPRQVNLWVITINNQFYKIYSPLNLRFYPISFWSDKQIESQRGWRK